MRILLASSDPTLRHKLHQDLSHQSFIVDGATNGEEAWELLQILMYDVVLLETDLPKLDGIALCRRLRDVGNPVLVLFLLEASGAEARVQGLDSGGDACLVKPIQPAELLAHLRALTRRGVRRASPLLNWGPLSLNPVAQQITYHDQVLTVNRKEYQILELFLSHPQKMLSCSEIGDRLWRLDDPLPSNATIKSHIRSIRRKLEQAGAQDFIQTHYGQGYCLDPVYANGTKHLDPMLHSPEPRLDSITAHIWQELMAANARLHQEVEQRKQIEAQLRRSEMMLRNAQRVAQVGCWEFDIATRETYWTEELFRIHGLDPNRPAPTDEEVLMLIHPDDRQLHEEVILAAVLRGEAFEANLRIVRSSDGAIRYINARGGPLFDHSGQIIKFTGTTSDVTHWLQTKEQP